MNKFIVALSCACASACVFADVGATPSKVTTNDWFSASVDGDAQSLTNCTITSTAKPTYADSKFVIDSEFGSPVTFQPNSSSGKDMTVVSFRLDTAIVPADARQNLTNTNAKVAFAASETNNNGKAYFAWLGGQDNNGWVQLDGATVGEDGASSYKLDVTFDNRGNDKKVQFKVDGVALTYGGTNWLSYASDKVSSTALAIDLVGSGNVTSITGNQLTIEAEVVPLAGGATIQVSEADMMAFETTLAGTIYTTVDAFLAASAKAAFSGSKFTDGVTVAEAYAIGLVTNNTTTGTMVPVDNGEIKVKADAQADVDDGIQVALNITPLDSSDTGARVSYQLLGSTDGKNYSEITSFNSPDAIVIPTSEVTGGKHFFKVVTQVTLESASN